ncbi:hypothetical protein D3C72_1991210 [compost metagenome]
MAASNPMKNSSALGLSRLVAIPALNPRFQPCNSPPARSAWVAEPRRAALIAPQPSQPR